jgi:hypothetical protein
LGFWIIFLGIFELICRYSKGAGEVVFFVVVVEIALKLCFSSKKNIVLFFQPPQW